MDALEQYIRDHTSPEEELLHELDRETNLRVIQPRMLSGHIQGRLLEMLVRMLRPRRVLEIGTFTGYSALCMAAGLEGEAELHTVEVEDELEELAHTIKRASLCGLGQSAPNPVLSTMRYFRDEYEAHVRDKKCPAGVCISMLRYVVDDEICKRCGICAKNCPVGAISGSKEEPYSIDQDKCIKCGVCMAKCPFKSIMKNA